MDCRKAKNLIPCAVDDELADFGLLQLRRHLAQCGSCAKYYELCKEQNAKLSSNLESIAFSLKLPSDFAATVAAQVVAEKSSSQNVFSLLRQSLFRLLSLAASNQRICRSITVAAIIGSVWVISMVAGGVLDSSPVISARLTSGHLVAFTIHPRPDGVDAGFDTHKYCRILKNTEESLP